MYCFYIQGKRYEKKGVLFEKSERDYSATKIHNPAETINYATAETPECNRLFL